MTTKDPFAALVPLATDGVAELRAEYPGVPEDYLAFLGSIGFGSVGSLTIYSALVEPTFIFGDDERELDAHYRAFADMNGEVVAAFDLRSWAVVEIDSRRAVEVLGDSFTAFMERWRATLAL